MKIIPKFFLLILLFSCKKQEVQIAYSIEEQEICDLTKIKLISPSSHLLQKDTASCMTRGVFHPVYIGEKKTEITLDYRSTFREVKDGLSYKYEKTNNHSLYIVVDTSRTIRSVTRKYIHPPRPEGVSFQDWMYENGKHYTRAVKAYPVFIENLTDAALDVGAGNIRPYIPLLMEAIDSTGTWSTVQKLYMHECGVGLRYLFLPPKNIMVTSCRLFEGEYKTKIRLAFQYDYEGFLYSNEFWGTMNYEQFVYSKAYY